MENRQVKIYAYNKAWTIENKVYSFFNWPLPVPVSPREVGYFAAVFIVMFLIGIVVPITQNLPVVIRFVAIPFGVMKFLLKKKLDGKMPLKYFAAWLQYQSTRGQCIERFQAVSGQETEKIRIEWFCSYGKEGNRRGRMSA